MKSQQQQSSEARILRKRIYLSGRTRVAVRSDSSQGNSYSSLSQLKKASSQEGKRLFFNFSGARRVGVLSLLVSAFFLSTSHAQDLDSIIQEARLQMRAKTMHAQLEVSVISGSSVERNQFELWSEGTEKAVLKSMTKNPSKRLSQLRVKDKLWNYQYTHDRVLPVSNSEMKNRLASSDLAYEDIVTHLLPSEGYKYQLLKSGNELGMACYKIAGIEIGKQKPRFIFWVTQAHSTLMRQERYDDEGKLEKILETRKVQELGNYHIPVTFAVRSVGEAVGHFTRVDLKNVQVDSVIGQEVFTQVFLKKSGASFGQKTRLIATENNSDSAR